MNPSLVDIAYALREVGNLLDVADSTLNEMQRPAEFAKDLEKLHAISRIAHRELDRLSEDLEKSA